MEKKILILYGIFVLSLILGGAQQESGQDGIIEISDDIKPYDGSIDPGSLLYGLKIAVENVDEGVTFNSIRKLEKQEMHARLRIAEAKAELEKNNIDDAERALEEFRGKIRASEDLILKLEDRDINLLPTQKMVVRNQFVLAQLLGSHPNVTGLQRAFDNSIELEDRFELRSGRKLARIGLDDRGRIRLQEVSGERAEVRARITGNSSDIRVEIRFLSTSTDRDAIAQEILDRFRMSRENISSLLDINVEREDLQRDLEAKAEISNNISHVESEFRFPLNDTNRTEIVEGIFLELSDLKKSDILEVLEIRVEEREGVRRQIEKSIESEELKIRAEISGNSAEAKVKLEFLTESTDSPSIAQEIRNRLNLGRDEIDNMLKVETEDKEISLRERLDIEVKVKKSVTEVKFELRFPLNTTSRSEIVEGIFRKLSTVSISSSDIEFRERREERGDDRIEDRIGEDGQDGRDDGRDGRRGAGDDRRIDDNGRETREPAATVTARPTQTPTATATGTPRATPTATTTATATASPTVT